MACGRLPIWSAILQAYSRHAVNVDMLVVKSTFLSQIDAILCKFQVHTKKLVTTEQVTKQFNGRLCAPKLLQVLVYNAIACAEALYCS